MLESPRSKGNDVSEYNILPTYEHIGNFEAIVITKNSGANTSLRDNIIQLRQ